MSVTPSKMIEPIHFINCFLVITFFCPVPLFVFSTCVTELREFVAANVHAEVPTTLRIMLRRLLNALCKEDDAAYKAAMTQIDEATFSRAKQ